MKWPLGKHMKWKDKSGIDFRKEGVKMWTG